MNPSPAEVMAADRWWEEQTDARRVQICSWITQRRGGQEEVPGQLELLEGGEP